VKGPTKGPSGVQSFSSQDWEPCGSPGSTALPFGLATLGLLALYLGLDGAL